MKLFSFLNNLQPYCLLLTVDNRGQFAVFYVTSMCTEMLWDIEHIIFYSQWFV